MRITKMCLKHSFSHSKWVLQVILSLTVFSTCVFGSSKFHSIYLFEFIWFCSVFMLLNRKFNKDSKNMLKTVIFWLQVSFTVDFVSDCLFKLCFWQFKFWQHFSCWLYLILQCFFMLLGRKMTEVSNNVLKTVIFPLLVGFTGDYVSDYPFKLCFW